jgi:hypothetical protein
MTAVFDLQRRRARAGVCQQNEQFADLADGGNFSNDLGETWARWQLAKAKSLMSMVGGRGIEPLTPSMSRKCSAIKHNR